MNKFKKWFDNDNYQNGLRTVIICVLAVILVVGVNTLSGVIPTKIGNLDVSTDRVFSMAKDTEAQLQAIDKDVQIIYVAQSGSEIKNAEVLLNLFAEASNHITVEKIDPAYNPTEVAKYAGDATVSNNSIIVCSNERRQVIQYSDYLSGGKFVLEDYLISAVKFTAGETSLVAYNLTGHNEQKLHLSTKEYMGLDGFEIQDLDLVSAGSVPSDASLVIINGINTDITEKESAALLSYIRQGGSLLLITDYTVVKMPNIEALTGYFNAETGQGLIMEADSSRYTQENPAYIFANIYAGDYTITKGINYVLMPNSKPIIMPDENDLSVKSTELLGTSESAVSVYENVFTNQTLTEEGPFTIAASFEKGEKGSEGKMIWIASKYISDVQVSESVGGGNITFFLNSVCWLGQDEPVESVHAKTTSSQYLTISGQTGNILGVCIIVVPVIVLVGGIVVCLRRRKR